MLTIKIYEPEDDEEAGEPPAPLDVSRHQHSHSKSSKDFMRVNIDELTHKQPQKQKKQP